MRLSRLILAASLGISCGAAAAAAEPDPQGIEFFEKKIRPLLVSQCYECHGNGRAKGGLSLESGTSTLKGGDSGEALVPGKPEASLLIEAVGHLGDMKMPPKQRLADAQIADLRKWIELGAPWPAAKVAISLGNLFDDDADVALGDALASNEFKATAEEGDLAVGKVLHGWGSVADVATGFRFDFQNVGSSAMRHGEITNDGWSAAGGLQTLGKRIAENAEKIEEGIGLHANALITFDLAALRAAGGLDANQAFQFRSDRAGLNDCVFGTTGPEAHLIVLVSGVPDAVTGDGVTGYVNGRKVDVQQANGIFHFSGEIPPPLVADGRFASFSLPVPGTARYLTLAATGANGLGGNSISSDHTVFSGARLEFEAASSEIARLRGGAPPPSEFAITPEQRQFWSFQPLRDAPPPAVQDTAWPRTAIDRFVLAELESRGLKPVAAADRRALIRRATFDLTGLPPAPAEVEAFVSDGDQEAFAKVVDRLLASPHYGERWGRHWLDVARYAEDQAHTFQARVYPNGFRYRDWVVQAFNRDLPYDRFLTEQIAGDLLPGADENDRYLALGYFALGPVYYKDAGCANKAALDELDDRIDTLGRGLLGLTLACARCHDHKFDPISQQDYYALGGIFSSSSYREAPLVPPAVVAEYDAAQKKIKEHEDSLNKFLDAEGGRLAEAASREAAKYLIAVWKLQHPAPDKPAPNRGEVAKQEGLQEFILERWQKSLAADSKERFPQWEAWSQLTVPAGASAEAIPPEVQQFATAFQMTVSAALDERDALQKQSAEAVAAAGEADKAKVSKPMLEKAKADLLAAVASKKGLCAVPRDKVEGMLAGEPKQVLTAMKAEAEQLKKAAPPKYPVAHTLTDGTGSNMKLHIRGNPTKTGAEVPRRFLSILAGENPPAFTQGSGRLELARAVASPDNPLTARVLVNRVWQNHFGRGLVGTPSNFGALGERPTHPLLLDHLARQFIASGWSMKALHREILLSAVYQSATDFHPQNAEVDPENRLLWRMNRRRLDVEAWRDALLSVSGRLDPTVGGPSGNLAAADNCRRTIYGAVSRHNLDGLLRLFDFPDPNITSERRTTTTVPLQQLFVLNSDFMIQQTRALVGRLNVDKAADDAARIQQAFGLLYGRPATPEEVALGLEFLNAPLLKDDQGQELKGQLSPWEQYAQVLLGANEFIYLD
jgi:hypothetical protein